MLEEIGLPYEAHRVSFDDRDQYSPEFSALNPNNRIPAIIDPAGPGGEPLPLFESGAILWYLAEKTGQLLPRDAALRYATLQWLMFQMANVGPMFGQVGFFNHFAGREWEDKRPLERYITESRRLLQVLEGQLATRRWIIGDDYTIADIATFPWVHHLVTYYEAAELLKYSEFSHVRRATQQFLERPAVIRGMQVPRRAATT
jgi:GST-like protein